MGKYLQRLTDEEIERFLEENNYILVSHLKDNQNNLLPAIERTENTAFIRCKKKDSQEPLFDNEVAYYLMKKHPGFLSLPRLLSSHYNSDIEALFMNDFSLTKFCLTQEDQAESDKLDEAFVYFMYDKFKQEGYKEDYEAYFENLENNKEDGFERI